MAGFETYTSRVRPPGAQALPQLNDRSATAGAMVRLGGALGGFGQVLREAQGAAQKARATTGYLESVQQLDKEFENDADPTTAAERYAKREAELREQQLGMISDPAEREQARTQLTRYGVTNQTQAGAIFLRKQADGFQANLDAQQTDTLNRASRAGSPAQRQAILDRYFSQADEGAQKGWITRQAAQARKDGLTRAIDDNDAVKLISENPQAALTALADPARFPTLTPEVRQARLQQAQAKADALGTAELTNVAKFAPVRAIAMLGRVTNREQIGQVVAQALIPQESNGNPNATSPAGAAGLTQFMPDTARATARRMRIADLEGLDDEGVRQVLRARPDLARRMGVTHLGDLAERYEGRLAPAFAGYHAGQGAADKWHAAAVEKFGPGYTPAQFASVIPDSVSDGQKKTKDYVADMFRRLGADPARMPALSQAGTYQAISGVGSELAAQVAEQKRIINQLASVAGEDASGIVAALKGGYAQDPNLISQTRSTLTQAAALGNADAGRQLRQLDFAERIAPAVREAYAMPPDRLQGAIAAEEARLAQAPHVSAPERERVQVMRTVAETITRERNSSPVGLLERAGAPPVAMPQELLAGDMAGALARRSQQAEEAMGRFGGELKPFKAFETTAYKAQFEGFNGDERFRFAAQAAANMSDTAYEAAMNQLGADKLTITAGRLSTYDQALGQKVARGAALLKQKGVDDGKAADLRNALGATLGGSVYPAAVQGDMIDAALAVYVADRDGKGALFEPSDQRALEGAIESVTGKLAKINGVKVPLPRGVSAGRLELALAGLTLEDIGGIATGRDGKPVDLDFIRSQARLRPQGYGDGRYLLALPGPQGADAFVAGADGQPLVVDLMPAIKRAESAWPQTEQGQREQAGRARAGIDQRRVPDWSRRGFLDLGGAP
jgi:soluble lytic murein transglycosylase-like protein